MRAGIEAPTPAPAENRLGHRSLFRLYWWLERALEQDQIRAIRDIETGVADKNRLGQRRSG